LILTSPSNLDLIEKKEEIEAKIRDIFDTPDMKKVVYRLKAVLGSDGQPYEQRFYAYIWVSKGNKTENISSNSENGNWWKFCDKTVKQVRVKYKYLIFAKNTFIESILIFVGGRRTSTQRYVWKFRCLFSYLC
jgi:hypothetical protein